MSVEDFDSRLFLLKSFFHRFFNSLLIFDLTKLLNEGCTSSSFKSWELQTLLLLVLNTCAVFFFWIQIFATDYLKSLKVCPIESDLVYLIVLFSIIKI